MVLTVFIKYILHTVDLQSENPWDNKAVYMLYTELFTGDALSSSRRPRQHWEKDRQTDVMLTTTVFIFRFHQSAALHCLHDHHDQGAHVPPVRHSPHVSGHEVGFVCVPVFL